LTLVLDVLEHVEDDAGLLASLGGLTRPGGHLLISVPGWPALYGTHDRQLRHHRRYLPRRAMGLLRKSGFSILRQGGLFHSLLSVRTGELLRERLLGSPVRAERELAWHHGPAVTRAIMSLLRLDNALSRWTSAHDISLPGLSWWAVCRYDENELTDRGGG
jgi:SAM-dependent methyltransferase